MSLRIHDFGLLLLRLGCAFALIPHGWNKVFHWGFAGTAAGFSQMGVPYPHLSAAVAIAAELGGSVLIAVGLFTPLAALSVIVTMVGGIVTAPQHFFAEGGMKGGLLAWHTAGEAWDKGTGFLDEGWMGAPAFLFLLIALAVLITGPGTISFDGARGRVSGVLHTQE